MNYEYAYRDAGMMSPDEVSGGLPFARGAVRGIGENVNSLLQMIRHPGNALMGFADAGKALARNPRGTVNALLSAEGNRFRNALTSPEAMGEYAGSFVDPMRMAKALKAPVMSEITAYHGTPHNFDQFDMSKIGTGEGAQIYGHGLYFAESPHVAKTYTPRDPAMEKRLMTQYSRAEAAGDYDAASVFEDALLHKSPSEVRRLREEMLNSGDMTPEQFARAELALKSFEREFSKKKTGFTYEVDIPDESVAHMLDWDRPFSQQPESVRKALGKLAAGDDPVLAELFTDGVPHYALGTFDNSIGGQIYRTLADRLGGPDVLSRRLKELGIPGIRYLDQASRADRAGTSNFVVFDDKLPKILKKE
jgi:hypothetical protein